MTTDYIYLHYKQRSQFGNDTVDIPIDKVSLAADHLVHFTREVLVPLMRKVHEFRKGVTFNRRFITLGVDEVSLMRLMLDDGEFILTDGESDRLRAGLAIAEKMLINNSKEFGVVYVCW